LSTGGASAKGGAYSFNPHWAGVEGAPAAFFLIYHADNSLPDFGQASA
jgi:hypothetical protein